MEVVTDTPPQLLKPLKAFELGDASRAVREPEVLQSLDVSDALKLEHKNLPLRSFPRWAETQASQTLWLNWTFERAREIAR